MYKNVHEYGNRYCKGVSHLFFVTYMIWFLNSHFPFAFTGLIFQLSVCIDFQGVFGLYQGASNHEELHNLMKATAMIRRLKKDVLSELPVKRRQQVCTTFFVLQFVYVVHTAHFDCVFSMRESY